MTISQISSGLLIDLLRPDLDRVDIRRDIAEPLADLARFNGHKHRPHPKGHIWSVGQHCVVGAKALLEETDNPLVALAFLVHDGHEFAIGDITTPTARAIEAEVAAIAGVAAGAAVRVAIRNIKARIDVAIWRLAGIAPPPQWIRDLVAEMDHRMLAAEARQILGVANRDLPKRGKGLDLDKARPVRTHGALSPWPSKRVADEWMALWTAWTTEIARTNAPRARRTA